MITQQCTIRVDRFSGRKARHPNLPATQTNLGTMIGDSIMKHIDVSTPKYPNKFALVDNKDYKWLNQWKWHVCKDSNYARWYVCRGKSINGKMKVILMHRFIMNTPKKMHTDHINHDALDNRRDNLRICTVSQNVCNQRKQPNHTSKYKGVTWHKQNKYWMAQIVCNYKHYYLGCFVNEKDAAKAYNKAAKKQFGEFAHLNDMYAELKETI